MLNVLRVIFEGFVYWVRDCYGYVFFYVFDSIYKKFFIFINVRISIFLVYIVKGYYCFFISDYNLKIVVIKVN